MQAVIDNSFGNRCGHVPASFRAFPIPPAKKGRPKVLQNAIEKCQLFYAEHDKYLPRLRFANGNDFQQRSERREAIGALLQVIFHYTDLESLTVGTPTKDGTINGLRIEFIANKLNFGSKRVWRALNDLKAAHYIDIKTRLKKVGKRYFSISTLKLFPSLFLDLDIGHTSLQLSRHYKQKSLGKAAKFPIIPAKLSSNRSKRADWHDHAPRFALTQTRQQAMTSLGDILNKSFSMANKSHAPVVEAIKTPITPPKPAQNTPTPASPYQRQQGGNAMHKLLGEGWTVDTIKKRLNVADDISFDALTVKLLASNLV